jgi:hypothetical protein
MYYFVVNLFGLTIGPTGIAIFTDYVFKDTHALPYSIACISALGGLLAVAFLFYNLGQYRKAVTESMTWTGGTPA